MLLLQFNLWDKYLKKINGIDLGFCFVFEKKEAISVIKIIALRYVLVVKLSSRKILNVLNVDQIFYPGLGTYSYPIPKPKIVFDTQKSCVFGMGMISKKIVCLKFNELSEKQN